MDHSSLLEHDTDLSMTCPKFFEKTDLGCEKPLSLWRGNGQNKKCHDCQ